MTLKVVEPIHDEGRKQKLVSLHERLVNVIYEYARENTEAPTKAEICGTLDFVKAEIMGTL